MSVSAAAALWFLPFVLPICFFVALSDLRDMRIPNQSVLLLAAIFLIVGLFVLPLSTYGTRLLQLGLVLIIGIVLNAAGAVGAGDAKFAAAAAPYVAVGDLRLLIAIFAANLLAAFATHRLVKYTPLRRIAPNWKSWDVGWKFPMGLSLGATLAIYLIFGAMFGS
ncbi:prepilin peptidase [Microbulbifer sp. S227A]|uniref:prepilin peptidase n=1 Tax=Microbulbifer sp. S227A TaxID=3415131 RepID=UPI003C7BEC9F